MWSVVSVRRHNVLLANTTARSPQLSHHEPPSPTATTQSAYLQRSVAEHEGQGRSSPSAETVIWSGSTVARPLVLIITCSRAIKRTRCSQTWALSCRRTGAAKRAQAQDASPPCSSAQGPHPVILFLVL